MSFWISKPFTTLPTKLVTRLALFEAATWEDINLNNKFELNGARF